MKLHLALINYIGLIVPRRLRADWRQEWEAELIHREMLLAEWERLNWQTKFDLMRRSVGAFWDALVLQPRRLEDEMFQDLRFGARMLMKNPGFTLLAVITLGLGIGANTALFSVVNGVLLRPLPYPESERLVGVWEDPGGRPRNRVNPRNFEDWRAQNQVFEQASAYLNDSFNLTNLNDGDEPERLIGAQTSANFFATLRVNASMGRTFLAGEDQPGRERVVVLSHSLWQRLFGGDKQILGRSLQLNGEQYSVIGVAPLDFGFPERAEFWTPLIFEPQRLAPTSRGSHYLQTIARLKPGVSIEQARADLERIYGGLREQYPEELARWQPRVFSMLDDAVGDVRQALWVLLGAVGFVLLIACVNTANLQLARASARQKEMAMRAALGAGRRRLIRQLLTESLLLALLGGGLGLLIGWLGLDLLVALKPQSLPRLDELGLDGRVLGFTLAATLLSAVICGLAPAWRAGDGRLLDALKESSARAGGGGRLQGLRRLFVASEMALALILLIGAGLFFRSFHKLTRVDPGFNADRVLQMRVALPRQRYAQPSQMAAFYQEVVQRVRTLPGVESASFISDPPVSGSSGLWQNGFDVVGRPSPPPGQKLFSYLRWVTPDYFQTLRIPLLRGRLLAETDALNRPWTVMIDESMARQFFPNEDPLGKRLMIYAGPQQQPREIVGIVGNVRATGLDVDAEPHMYAPYFQTPLGYGALLVRTTGDPLGLAAAVKNAILSVDRNQPVYQIATLDDRIAATVADRRFNLLALGLFAALAVVLAAVGIYGVMSYTVSQRSQEIGVRIALGAKPRDILKLVTKQGLTAALAGVGAGLLGALALTRLISGLLFGVSATDPWTFMGVASLLLLIALLACFLPARRATQVDPLEALRRE